MSQHKRIGQHDKNDQNDKNELEIVKMSLNDQNEST